jgi:hypothetical protein
LARERYHTDNPSQDANIVTTGGSGFGLMTILVGIKNGYISRAEAVSRLTTLLISFRMPIVFTEHGRIGSMEPTVRLYLSVRKIMEEIW